MVFWESWSNLYRFLFVVWAIISFICRVIAARIREKLEAGYQLELLERPPESTRVQRSHSVNFGVRALDFHETPAEAGIVDSESLRVFSPASRFSRISSPASSGGRKDSESTIGSVSETAGLNINGRQSYLPPPSNYVPQMIPRGFPPFISPSAAELGIGNPGPSRSPIPITAQNTGGSRSSSAGSNFKTAPNTPGLQGDLLPYFLIPPTHPYSNYLQVPSHHHRRPVSTSSITEIVPGSSGPSQPTVKGILKNHGQVQHPVETLKGRRSVTPGRTSRSPLQNGSVVGAEIDISVPPTPTSGPQPPHPRSRSAPPLKNRQQSSSAPYQSQNLTNIPEAYIESPDGIELKERPRKRSTENIPALAGPSTATGPTIPHPTRAPPPIPFLSRSPAPASSTSAPLETTKNKEEKTSCAR
ncbi:hypothetical protein TWF281_008177 [Arthrobotrys megalospora]